MISWDLGKQVEQSGSIGADTCFGQSESGYLLTIEQVSI